ncbi:response regulator [Patescibacteria group bacterium]|nr:response regulator [Patescibacteria group bacterium]
MARILICDDAAFMRMTIRETLENAGHEIIGEAEDGNSAIEIYKKSKPDLVTMDILMKTSGVEAVKKLKDLDPNAKIVMVSILDEQEAEVIEAVRSGAEGIVTKPIKREMLTAEVNRVLRKGK